MLPSTSDLYMVIGSYFEISLVSTKRIYFRGKPNAILATSDRCCLTRSTASGSDACELVGTNTSSPLLSKLASMTAPERL